ncbi:MAG: Heat shock protein 60 family co-chaperone GroES, partial [uncultured Frankineae bacterium]
DHRYQGRHQAARGPHRGPGERRREHHRLRPRHPGHRQGEAPGGHRPGRGPGPLRGRQPRSARRQGRRQGPLQQVRRHRGQVRRRGVPRALRPRRARRHRGL